MTKQFKRGLGRFAAITLSFAMIYGIKTSLIACYIADQKSVIDEQKLEKADLTSIETPFVTQNAQLIIEEPKVIQEEKIIIEEEIILNPYVEIIDNLTEEEKELLLKITFAESGNQEIEGQRAVIEVILNRVISDKFPNDVISVLSQKGQFSTWKLRNKVSNNEDQVTALQEVYENEPILSSDYLYFSRGKQSYAKDHVKIQDHWFGKSK